jgi:ubiquinone/menaquinone biosynthesis C-methylase UbiE
MPGGVEMTLQAEQQVAFSSDARWLSVACGTGELELYLAQKYGCSIVGVDVGEWAVERARKKAAARGLDHLVSFEMGDGRALPFGAGTFDGVFCSGALCAFFDQGMDEFRRVLRPGGTAVVLEVSWRREPVPEGVVERWAGGEATILTVEGHARASESRGFGVRSARGYHEPTWWEAYYDDRGDAPHWQEERVNYVADQAYLGVGLFVLEKA